MPRPLFIKLAATFAAGFFCLVIGTSYAFTVKDRMFLFMSLALFLCCLVKGCLLYHMIRKKRYVMVIGTCIEIKRKWMQRSRQAFFETENGDIIDFTLERSIKIRANKMYILYFEAAGSLNGHEIYPTAPSMRFLCMEEIATDMPKL